MYLRTLDIIGFKCFGEQFTIEFHDGPRLLTVLSQISLRPGMYASSLLRTLIDSWKMPSGTWASSQPL